MIEDFSTARHLNRDGSFLSIHSYPLKGRLAMAFCTVINCMDGRVQLPVINYLIERCGADYVDSITEAGPVKTLSENTDQALVESIFRRVAVSTEKHGSPSIAVCAHADCAGNPLDENSQKQQLVIASQGLREKFPGCEILLLWVDAAWVVHELS